MDKIYNELSLNTHSHIQSETFFYLCSCLDYFLSRGAKLLECVLMSYHDN